MSEIQQLNPTSLWKWFDQICAIPHPSYQENELAEFIVNWAKGKGFYAERDEAGNVLIRKPATKGMENRKKVALQAHLDMVPQANEGSHHNFATDPILPYIDGEWVHATNTTLGADNGIGIYFSHFRQRRYRSSGFGSVTHHDRRTRHGRRPWLTRQLVTK